MQELTHARGVSQVMAVRVLLQRTLFVSEFLEYLCKHASGVEAAPETRRRPESSGEPIVVGVRRH